MRVLLDENLPVELAYALAGHAADTVTGLGWAGVTNGELLQRASGNYDAFLTMDGSIEHQQRIAGLPLGIVVLRAPSNRMLHLQTLVPEVLQVLAALRPGVVVRVGA